MKYLILCLVLSLTGCDYHPIEDGIDQATMNCEEIVNQYYEQIQMDVWEECTAFYEEVVIPNIRNEIDQATQDFIDSLEQLIEDILADVEDEIFTRFGCVPDSSPAGWDCTNASICVGP